MKVNEEGRALIKRFEGLRLKAYRCPAGVLTVGYGHTRDPFTGKPDVEEGRTLKSEHEADILLSLDLEQYEDGVSYATQNLGLTDNQFSALVSFAFNLGLNKLLKSQLLRKLLRGDVDGAAAEFPKWKHVGTKELPGLVARRAAERELFLRDVT